MTTSSWLVSTRIQVLAYIYTRNYSIGIYSRFTPNSTVLISWGIRLSNNLFWEGLTHGLMQARWIILSRVHSHVIMISNWLRTTVRHVNSHQVRGRGHVIAIINWPGPQSGTWSSRFCLQSSVCQARPKDIIPGCPFRQVITIINITYINIGVCCSVINWSIVFTLCMVYDGATDHTSPPDQTGIVSPWEGGS